MISPLPTPTVHITGHNSSGTSQLVRSQPQPPALVGKSNHFTVAYTTSSMPADLNDSTDITQHDVCMASGTLGLVKPHGTVCRVVDFEPGAPAVMHQTQSLDYGIVVEGEVVLHLSDGSQKTVRRGDVVVQRATMHAWQNKSAEEWARMVFVLQDIEPLFVNGRRVREELGPAAHLVPASGNDG